MIPQYVVAVKDHSTGHFKKDDVFPVLAVTPPVCSCGYQLIDIGVHIPMPYRLCGTCGQQTPSNVRGYNQNCFAHININAVTLPAALTTPLLKPQTV